MLIVAVSLSTDGRRRRGRKRGKGAGVRRPARRLRRRCRSRAAEPSDHVVVSDDGRCWVDVDVFTALRPRQLREGGVDDDGAYL
jgi:hypothetical protein